MALNYMVYQYDGRRNAIVMTDMDGKQLVIDCDRAEEQVVFDETEYQYDNVMMLCKSYDRGLCDTIEEYEKLDLKYIESQAYGSWMDGAR